MEPKKKNKKRFVVVGINRPRNLIDYAQLIEREMNKMNRNGRSVMIRDEDRGVIIVGELAREDPFSFEAIMSRGQEIASDMDDIPDTVHPRTRELLQRFNKATPTPFVPGAVTKVMSSCVLGFSMAELMQAVQDMPLVAEWHAKNCRAVGACDTNGFLQEIIEALQSAARLSLQ